jgi:hypothetical protein
MPVARMPGRAARDLLGVAGIVKSFTMEEHPA